MHFFLGLSSALLATAVPASAAVLVSLDRATFQASAGSLSGQSFDSFSNGAVLTDDGFIVFSTTGGLPVVTSDYLTSTPPNGLGATNDGFFLAGDTLSLAFGDAIGAFGIDINTFATDAGSYNVTLNNGDQAFSIFETFPGFGTGQFIGFVTDTPFTSLTLSANTTRPYTVDTILYGDAEDVVVNGAVPEPATWVMMLLGFGLIGGSIRAAKRRQALTATYA